MSVSLAPLALCTKVGVPFPIKCNIKVRSMEGTQFQNLKLYDYILGIIRIK